MEARSSLKYLLENSDIENLYNLMRTRNIKGFILI